MKIKELEYLPVTVVEFLDGNWYKHVDVSLYGHWCHVRTKDETIISFPASVIERIVWA